MNHGPTNLHSAIINYCAPHLRVLQGCLEDGWNTRICTVIIGHGGYNYKLILIKYTSRVPVEGESSVCAISMKYRIMIIISLGQIIYYRILQTHHARTHVRTHTPFRLSLFDGSVCPTMPKLTPPFRRFRWR